MTPDEPDIRDYQIRRQKRKSGWYLNRHHHRTLSLQTHKQTGFESGLKFLVPVSKKYEKAVNHRLYRPSVNVEDVVMPCRRKWRRCAIRLLSRWSITCLADKSQYWSSASWRSKSERATPGESMRVPQFCSSENSYPISPFLLSRRCWSGRRATQTGMSASNWPTARWLAT